MGFFSRFLPKKPDPNKVVLKNNIPKEKEAIRKMFGIFCNSNHNPTDGKKLCPKCTALLATIMLRMSRCQYGITKPNCEKCPTPCFTPPQYRDLQQIMAASERKFFLRHPIMAIKHRLYGMRKEETEGDNNSNKKKPQPPKPRIRYK